MQARKFYIDIQQRAFVSGASSTLPASTANFTQSDTESIELYFLKPSQVTPPYEFVDYSASTVKLAIGNTGNPSSGSFKISDSTSTTAALDYNLSAASLQSALNALSGGLFGAGNCSVTGSLPRFIVTVGADSAGAVSSLAVDDNELAPASNIRFIQRQAASPTAPLIFDLVVERQPAVLASAWSALPSTVTASVSTLVAGGAGTSEQQQYGFNREPSSGTYSLKFPARTITVSSVSAGLFTAAAHGLYDNQIVTLTGFTISASSFANTAYYVTARTNDTFRILSSVGGSAITANAVGGGSALLSDITTGPIAHSATAQDVQTAIAAAGFQVANVNQIVVSGIPRQTFTLTYANGSSGINFPQVEIVGSTLVAPKGLVGTIDLNTIGVRDLISSGENTSLLMEVEAIASGNSTQTYTQAASIGSEIITAASQPTPPVTTYNAGFMRVETGITGLEGGGANNLDGLATANGTYPTNIVVFVIFNGVPQMWQLTSGTQATDIANGILRPADYATTTNEKVWLQRM